MHVRPVIVLLVLQTLLLTLVGLVNAQGSQPDSGSARHAIAAIQLPSFGTIAYSGTALGVNNTGSGIAAVGLAGRTDNGYAGVVGFSENKHGVYGRSNSRTDSGVFGDNTSSGIGVWGKSVNGDGVYGTTSGFGSGVYGLSTDIDGIGVEGSAASGEFAVGVWGSSFDGDGVYGTSVNQNGVLGQTSAEGDSGSGVLGIAYGADSTGVQGVANSGSLAYGVWGRSTSGQAGHFDGAVHVVGRLSKTTGSFTIDHPLDPANKYLSHSFVESPDMLNIYSGVVTTDANGDATAILPAYFEALNRDFRYQLTIIGKQWAQARIEEEIKDNRFTIKTDKPHIKVSWQVTGVRQDAYARAHPILVEESKPALERGHYLHPEVFGQPADKSIAAARRPEILQPNLPKTRPSRLK